MARNSTSPGWTTDVVRFLTQNLPSEDGKSWDHMFSSAYQMGCELLVALGHAEETDWGAVARAKPRLPEPLPRWDDVCVAAVNLAEQQGGIDYRLPDGRRLPARGRIRIGVASDPRWAPPAPNISATKGLGAAFAHPDTLKMLQSLGLVTNAGWADGLEVVFWRIQPAEWAMDVRSNPRFVKAVENAVGKMPDEIRAEIDRLSKISDADVTAAVAQSEAHDEELRAKYGPNANISKIGSGEQVRSGLIFARAGDLDWFFFRRWRLDEGWMTGKTAERALEIFHDPLAMAMRRAVLKRLCPDTPFGNR